ncbi:MAG TPA: maleylpyruvate isomerase N-terminal domain-containing protein [Pseudonocardia sp.]|nr:maleylpyruvate isomerase N-terminal domain-containing protein [Pseudonocardia sp.]
MTLDRAAALRREHAEIVRFCRQLGDEEWRAPSAAPGWRVQDVVAHLGGSCHAIFTPTSLKLLSSKDIERTNDVLVARRRDWEPARVLGEFERWGRRLGTLTSVLSRTPVARVPAPLGELGRFPAAVLLSSAFLFDQHTHLRHDIAPALGRPAPATDGLRMSLVLEWMFAVLGNQLRAARPPWLTRPISISLAGAGGGRWRIGVDGGVTAVGVTAVGGTAVGGTAVGGDGGVTAVGGTAVGTDRDSVTHIAGAAVEFPGWATHRAPWRERDVRIEGDEALGTALLDHMNVV